MQSLVKVLIFITFVNIAAAGVYRNQTNVPTNLDCGCIGFASLASKCGWTEKSCSSTSPSFVNYKYWCGIVNQYYEDRRNGNTEATYQAGLHCDSNLSESQVNAKTIGLVEPKAGPSFAQSTSSYIYPFNASLPTAVNWTSSMTPIKSQNGCNSCWAFVSVALCEWWYKNKSPPSVILSEQALVDCNTSNDGCKSGWPSKALDWLRVNGTANSTYTYNATQSTCKLNSYKNYKCPLHSFEWYTPTSYPAVPTGNCTRLRQLLSRGPVAATIYVKNSFNVYTGGLYTDTTCPSDQSINHGVVVTGYGIEPESGKPAFIVRNSWGTKFGNNGYIYFDASQSICSLCTRFWYY